MCEGQVWMHFFCQHALVHINPLQRQKCPFLWGFIQSWEYLNIECNLIHQRQQRNLEPECIEITSLRPNRGSWHHVIGKLNYNIRLNVITVEFALLKTWLAPEFTSSALPWLRQALWDPSWRGGFAFTFAFCHIDTHTGLEPLVWVKLWRLGKPDAVGSFNHRWPHRPEGHVFITLVKILTNKIKHWLS